MSSTKAACCLYGYPSKCRVCIVLLSLAVCMPIYSVWCRPGVHWWSIQMASPIVWIRQLSGASLDLSHSDLVRYRCYIEKICGCTSSALADLRASLATCVYMVHGMVHFVHQIYMIVLLNTDISRQLVGLTVLTSRLLRGESSCCFDPQLFTLVA